MLREQYHSACNNVIMYYMSCNNVLHVIMYMYISCLLLCGISHSLPLPLYHNYVHSVQLIHTQDEAALIRAAGSGDVGAVKRLLRSPVNINCQDSVSYYMHTFSTSGLCSILEYTYSSASYPSSNFHTFFLITSCSIMIHVACAAKEL